MSSRPTLTILAGTCAAFAFSACKTVYSDTFSYRKNSFKAPVEKTAPITAPVLPVMPDAGPGGALPGAPGGLPEGGGAIPGIPGAPGADAVPAAPGTPPAVPALPGL